LQNLTQIQVQIHTTLNEVNSINKINSHLEQINISLEDLYEKVKNYERKLNNELKDIQKLEENSVKSLFHSVLGNKTQQLEKERQEYLETSLKFKEYSKRLQILEFEKEVLEKKTKDFVAINAKLQDLKNRRKIEILNSSNSEIKNSLEKNLMDLDESVIIKKELTEAIIEGENCIKLLKVVISYLKKARDWGKWNNTNNRRGAYVKNRSIDNAIQNLSKAQFRLDKFSQELADLGDNYIRFDLKKSQFGQFTDFFFDNLISDWIVQQKIKNTISNVEVIIDKIQRILLGLKDENLKNSEKIEILTSAKNRILTS